MPLLIFILIFAAFYFVLHNLYRISPIGMLAKTYGTDRRATHDQNSFRATTITLTRDGDTLFTSRQNNLYDALLPEGYLICGPWLGDILRLNRNVLIPWSVMEFEKVTIGTSLPKFMKSLSSEYYKATIKTDDGVFRLHLDKLDFQKALDNGYIKSSSLKSPSEGD